MNEYQKQYRLEHKDEANRKLKEYRLANRDKINAQKRERYRLKQAE